MGISFLKELSPDVVTFGRMVTDSKHWTNASALLQETSGNVESIGIR